MSRSRGCLGYCGKRLTYATLIAWKDVEIRKGTMMYRDMQPIKRILQWAANKPKQQPSVPSFCGYTDEQDHYHRGLCKQAGYQAGYMDGTAYGSNADIPFRTYNIRGLTWAGHEAIVAQGGRA